MVRCSEKKSGCPMCPRLYHAFADQDQEAAYCEVLRLFVRLFQVATGVVWGVALVAHWIPVARLALLDIPQPWTAPSMSTHYCVQKLMIQAGWRTDDVPIAGRELRVKPSCCVSLGRVARHQR